jgi:probable F420-dependent oxidoreductase
MYLGITCANAEWGMPAHDLARAAEERGFESLWLPEHTHIPASRETPYLAGDFPEAAAHTADPFLSLAAAAVVTSRLRLATGISLVTQHDPIVQAKQVATLDRLSGGRFVFGVGAGWNREEMRNHGTDPARRWDVLRERLEAMKAIWTQEEASYHGDFVDFDRIWSYPKPVASPHPPILLGSTSSPRARRFVAEHCDGWMPLVGLVEDVSEAIAEIRAHAAAIDRRPESISITLVAGRPGVERLLRLRELGPERCVVFVPDAGPEEVLPFLDRYAEYIPKLD